MNRSAFLLPALTLLAVDWPHIARSRSRVPTTPYTADIEATKARAKTLVVRHLGAFVSTFISMTTEALAASKPVATTTDANIISSVLDAVLAAKPVAARQTSEQRWHLTFLDASKVSTLVVTSSIFAPRDGTIGKHVVLFENAALVRELAKIYAADEMPYLK